VQTRGTYEFGGGNLGGPWAQGGETKEEKKRPQKRHYQGGGEKKTTKGTSEKGS